MQIKSFAQQRGAKFPLFSKVDVNGKNGAFCPKMPRLLALLACLLGTMQLNICCTHVQRSPCTIS